MNHGDTVLVDHDPDLKQIIRIECPPVVTNRAQHVVIADAMLASRRFDAHPAKGTAEMTRPSTYVDGSGDTERDQNRRTLCRHEAAGTAELSVSPDRGPS